MHINTPFLTALFALSAAAAWGSGDFTGGLAARRVGPFHTVLISYTIGLVALTIIAIVIGEPFPSAGDMLWGAAAGLLGWVGLGFLLRGFSAGRMGIVAPVSASLATAIPVIFTALTQGLPDALRFIGFALAIAGIWLLSRPEPLGGRPAGLGMALVAGIGFGGFFTALDQVSEGALFWPLVAGRLACCLVMFTYAAAARRPVIPSRAPLGIIALAGILDVSGNLFFLLAVQAGRLDIATILGSLYPAVTAILAWLIAGERMARSQVFGVATALAAIILITI